MIHPMKPRACDPSRLSGLSEKLIVSEDEKSDGGAAECLNAITALIAVPDLVAAPVFVPNGRKREGLIAMDSMIQHEVCCAARLDGAGIAAVYRKGSIEPWIAELHPTASKPSRSSS